MDWPRNSVNSLDSNKIPVAAARQKRFHRIHCVGIAERVLERILSGPIEKKPGIHKQAMGKTPFSLFALKRSRVLAPYQELIHNTIFLRYLFSYLLA